MARSKEIAPSVGRLSRSQVAAKRGLHKGECCCWMGVHCNGRWGRDKDGRKNGQYRSKRCWLGWRRISDAEDGTSGL